MIYFTPRRDVSFLDIYKQKLKKEGKGQKMLPWGNNGEKAWEIGFECGRKCKKFDGKIKGYYNPNG